MEINDVEDLLYEVNEEGEEVVVQSIESQLRAFLRFTNLTQRPVDIWWRDFRGARSRYARIKPNAVYDVNTFITHPWEFTDSSTKERYMVNNKDIFRAPASVGGMMYRTNWNICVPMRTLRQTTLIAVALRIPHPRLASQLGLPRTLEKELKDLIEIITNITVEEEEAVG